MEPDRHTVPEGRRVPGTGVAGKKPRALSHAQ